MNRLKQLRVEADLTQAEFGRKFNASQNTVSNWENGNRRIDNEHLIEFAAFFDVSVDYLLGRTEESNSGTNKKQPTANGDGLDEQLVNLLVSLSPSEVRRVEDFVAGLIAARGDGVSHQD